MTHLYRLNGFILECLLLVKKTYSINTILILCVITKTHRQKILALFLQNELLY